MFKTFQIIYLRKINVIILISLFFLPINGLIGVKGQIIEKNNKLLLNTLYPSISFSTFLGGNSFDVGYKIVVDNNGSCYIGGNTNSEDFPVLNAYNDTYGGDFDAFIVKFFANNTLHWCTFLGGSNSDTASGVAITDDGNCYITGYTSSNNFPTLNAYNSTYGGGYNDAFVAKFTRSGSLSWSTYLGGNNTDWANSITVASDGSCYVTGYTESSDFPSKNSFDSTLNGTCDAFIAKFEANGSLCWSTFLGGNGFDEGNGIVVNTEEYCYVIGRTDSNDFPILNAYDDTQNNFDAFLVKFSAEGILNWSTFFGGSMADEGSDIVIATDGSCYITGRTESNDFPVKNAYDNTFNGHDDIFISKFTYSGYLNWSTYFGGSELDTGTSITLGGDDSCYVTGYTLSIDFPTLNAYNSTFGGGNDDTFVAKFSSTGPLLWSTYLGGKDFDHGTSVAVAGDGSCYVTGWTASKNFPIKKGYDTNLDGWADAFITQFIATSRTNRIYAYIFLGAFIILIPIIIMTILRKGRK